MRSKPSMKSASRAPSTSRRRFSQLAAGLSASAAAGMPFPGVLGAGKPHIVVIGGGVAGVIAARRLASPGGVSVTLIAPKRSYTSCFFGGHYLAGYRSLESLSFDYVGVDRVDNLEVVHDTVDSVDTGRGRVRLAGGGTLGYDRVIFATGVEVRLDSIEGYADGGERGMPHAYTDGADIQLLRRQLESMPDGGLVVIGVPPYPYRCPPAPYERATLIAAYLARHKPKSKVLVVDAKNSFPMQTLFERAWRRFYPGLVEWLPADMTGGIAGVDPARMVVKTDFENFEADVASIIPPQRAGKLVREAGLVDATGWCPVRAADLSSTQVAGAHVLGDAASLGKLPKTATAARSQAEVCAAAIRVELGLAGSGRQQDFDNACYMLLAEQHAVHLRSAYRVRDGSLDRLSIDISEADEPDAVRRRSADAGAQWYASLTGEMFG